MMFFQFDIGARRRAVGRLIGNIRCDLIKALTKEKATSGLTQQHLADALGISRSELNRTLCGEEEMTLRTIANLAWALNREVHFELREPSQQTGRNYFAETATVASGSANKAVVPGSSTSRMVRILVADSTMNIEKQQ